MPHFNPNAFLAIFFRLLFPGFFFIQFSSTPAHAASPSDKPNIIIFLVDDLGYGDLGCYGNPIIKTPNIDRFATEGVRLTDCHSAATVCSPSRAALLTGRNPYRSGFYDILGSFNCYLQGWEITLPELLKPAGYSTCFVGKWHLSQINNNGKNNGENSQPSPGEQGFDHWLATSLNAFEGPRNVKKLARNGAPLGPVSGSYCDIIVKEACDWIGLQKKDQPFFLEICPHEPHTPIDPPEEYSEPYRNATVDSLEKTIKYGGVPRPAGIAKHKDKYYGTVTQLDHAFGQLMKFLEANGLSNNTLVIFTSDNGPESPVNFDESRGLWKDTIRDQCFGTPGLLRGMKRFTYEGGHRVPGIVRWPSKIPAGIVSDKLVNGIDFFSTICAIAGAKQPDDRAIDGKNIWPALLNRPPDKNRSIMWLLQLNEDMYPKMPDMSMRYREYTLIGRMPPKADSVTLLNWMYHSLPEKFELYNIIKDPEQQFDIADQHPRLLRKLIPMMTKMWINIRDEGEMSATAFKPQK